MAYDFKGYKKDTLTKPRDKAWQNWAKFDKVGVEVQGFIRDVFYRKEEGQYKAQRGITLEQPDGTFVNVGIKRIPFVLDKTNRLRLGDPLTIVYESQMTPKQKGHQGAKQFGFYGKNLDENKDQPTVLELDQEDEKNGGTITERSEEESEADKEMDEFLPQEEAPKKKF